MHAVRFRWHELHRPTQIAECQSITKHSLWRRAQCSMPLAAVQPSSQGAQQPRPAAANSKQNKRPTQQDLPQIALQLPPAINSRVKKATYVSSSVTLKQCPPEKYAEFAVIGRSNVGKSSLINMLTETDGLAKVSKEPGMTKTINHFLINDSWYLVDLPGYGFAKSSKGLKIQWLDFTQQYFIDRDALVSVLLLVDSSVPPQQVDLECADWLAAHEVPFAIVFTKTDAKKKDSKGSAVNIRNFKLELLKEWEAVPPCYETSSKTGIGRSEVLAYISGLKQLHESDS